MTKEKSKTVNNKPLMAMFVGFVDWNLLKELDTKIGGILEYYDLNPTIKYYTYILLMFITLRLIVRILDKLGIIKYMESKRNLGESMQINKYVIKLYKIIIEFVNWIKVFYKINIYILIIIIYINIVFGV